jgi:hypothetical protein
VGWRGIPPPANWVRFAFLTLGASNFKLLSGCGISYCDKKHKKNRASCLLSATSHAAAVVIPMAAAAGGRAQSVGFLRRDFRGGVQEIRSHQRAVPHRGPRDLIVPSSQRSTIPVRRGRRGGKVERKSRGRLPGGRTNARLSIAPYLRGLSAARMRVGTPALRGRGPRRGGPFFVNAPCPSADNKANDPSTF